MRGRAGSKSNIDPAGKHYVLPNLLLSNRLLRLYQPTFCMDSVYCMCCYNSRISRQVFYIITKAREYCTHSIFYCACVQCIIKSYFLVQQLIDQQTQMISLVSTLIQQRPYQPPPAHLYQPTTPFLSHQQYSPLSPQRPLQIHQHAAHDIQPSLSPHAQGPQQTSFSPQGPQYSATQGPQQTSLSPQEPQYSTTQGPQQTSFSSQGPQYSATQGPQQTSLSPQGPQYSATQGPQQTSFSSQGPHSATQGPQQTSLSPQESQYVALFPQGPQQVQHSASALSPQGPPPHLSQADSQQISDDSYSFDYLSTGDDSDYTCMGFIQDGSIPPLPNPLSSDISTGEGISRVESG